MLEFEKFDREVEQGLSRRESTPASPSKGETYEVEEIEEDKVNMIANDSSDNQPVQKLEPSL